MSAKKSHCGICFSLYISFSFLFPDRLQELLSCFSLLNYIGKSLIFQGSGALQYGDENKSGSARLALTDIRRTSRVAFFATAAGLTYDPKSWATGVWTTRKAETAVQHLSNSVQIKKEPGCCVRLFCLFCLYTRFFKNGITLTLFIGSQYSFLKFVACS